MIRSAFGKVALLALTTAMAGAAVVGCSGDIESGSKSGESVSDGKLGQVGMNLQPVSGVILDTVTYSVTQGMGGTVVKAGSIPVPGTGADFSFGTNLPVGTNYFLTLSGATANGAVTCAGGFGPFAITANTAIDITPTLTCTDISTGQPIVLVDVTTTACPDITFDYVVATPKTAPVGQAISLLSNAVSASGKTLSYSWTASSAIGTFSPATSKDPSLACTTGGTGVVVTVTADNDECTKSISTKVSCANVLCGNGVVDAPGETCDTAIDPTCPADCNVECGDGDIEGSETCEPPNTAACTATCTARTGQVCGDGFITGTEECDLSATPTGATPTRACLAGCVLEATVGVCGDGAVNAAGETCDNMGGNNYAISNCGDEWGPAGATTACQVITPAACATCEAGSECAELTDNSILSGSAVEGPATGTPRTELYNKTLDCVRDTACAVANVLDCYCGTVSAAACDSGMGNGVCKAIIEQGLETTNPTEISNRLSNVTLGGGLALARVACDKNNCPAQCGL